MLSFINMLKNMFVKKESTIHFLQLTLLG